MQAKASPSNGDKVVPAAPAQVVTKVRHAPSPYMKVMDDRKRPFRDLWVRTGRYYAQLTLEDENTALKQVRRVRLKDAATPAQARKQLVDLVVNRRKGKLPVLAERRIVA